MSPAASQLGIFHQRQSDSHACSPVSPSTTETQCAQALFQQPPPRPPIYWQHYSLTTKVDSTRQYCQTQPRQSLYKLRDHERPARQEYEYLEVFESVPNANSTSDASQALHPASARGASVFYTDFKREEDDLFVPLSRHSRTLSGIFGQPAPLMSTEYLHSAGLQDYPTHSETVAEASFNTSSRSSSTSISNARNPATGSHSHFSALDTSIDTGDFTQYDTGCSSGETNAPDDAINDSGGDSSENDRSRGVGPIRSKKQRLSKGRERARIALAPDQPPTTQGKQRERVYVACQQCRSRKIRCDGAKPMCYNCNQRGTGKCDFDSVPKRRGPDRQPGARQRHGKVPVPRRKRPTRSDKEEAPLSPQRTSPYLEACCGNESTTVPYGQITTWAHIPSPPSSASTNGYHYAQEHPTPGSSGSDTSYTHHDYRSLLAPSFAYNAPQDGYVGATLRSDPDPRSLISRTPIDSVAPSSSAPLSSTFSPETPVSVSYSTVTSPFAAQALPYANVPSNLGTEGIGASMDNMSKLDSSTSPVANGLVDYGPHDLNVVQPIIFGQEPVMHTTYSSFGAPATQQRGNCDYLAVSDVGTPHSRRDSLGHATSDSYNPYQWAVHQYQGGCSAYVSSSDDEDIVVPYEFTITQTPSLDFVRKTWWDSLLDTYCAEPFCTPAVAARYESLYGVSVAVPSGILVTGTTRQRVAQIIVRDLQSVFKDSIFWFAFFNVPLFFGTFFRARETMQPALVLALLMFSNYFRSSMADLGIEGMRRTMWLKEKAQAALDASVNASWIDPTLAQAAWLIALFELSSQPMRSVPRLHSSLGTLDNIIHSLALTFIDAQDSSVSVPSPTHPSPFCCSNCSNGSISHILPLPLYNRQPIAGVRPKFKFSSQLLQYHSPYRDSTNVYHRGPSNSPATCICNDLALGKNWSEAKEHVPFWLNSPAWKPTWTDAEVRREECRRLCWNTLHLFAGYTTYRTSLGLSTLDLFLLHPSNVHNIFPGENLTDFLSSQPSTTKIETVWALYARAILLWHACLRIRNVSERERAIFAHSVWLEADAIENALDGHSCNTERSFLYHGREYLFNARMYVSFEFRRFVPHPSPDMSGAVHRRKAEEWLTHQATLAKRIMHGLQALTGVRGTVLAKRPFFCFWFMGHISRCLQLWQADKTLTVALELAKNFLSPVNYLSALWPCEDQRMQYANMRKQLENACYEAGLALPPPVDPSFPMPTNNSCLV